MKNLKRIELILASFAVATAVQVSEASAASDKQVAQYVQKVKALAPRVSNTNATVIAKTVLQAAKAHQVDASTMVAILKIESTFNSKAISNTGDFSMAQINYNIWSREMARIGRELDEDKLKKDHHYAIFKMAEILSILKTRYKGSDPQWAARYHSKTPALKNQYHAKIVKNIAIIHAVQYK